MTKHWFSCCAVALALSAGVLSLQATAQAVATATGRTLSLGVAYQNIDPDYGQSRASGVQVYGNYDVSRFWGLTAEANFQTAFSNVVFLEKTYLVGGRGTYHLGRYTVYGKALIGGASSSNNTNNPLLYNAPGTYPALGVGGGLDVAVKYHLVVRAIDYEEQHWFDYNPNSLTPHVFSFGVAYRFGE